MKQLHTKSNLVACKHTAVSYRVRMWSLVCKYDPDSPAVWCVNLVRWQQICRRVNAIADAWRELQARRADSEEAQQYNKAEARLYACADARWAAAEKILNTEAQSIEGLRVKALLTMDECKREHWNEEGTSEALIGKHLAELILQVSSRIAA